MQYLEQCYATRARYYNNCYWNHNYWYYCLIVLYCPENHGWLLNEGKFSLNWFEGEMSPASLEDIVVTEIEEDEEEVHHESASDDSDEADFDFD